MKAILDPIQRETYLAETITRQPIATPEWIDDWMGASASGTIAVLVALDCLTMVLTRPESLPYETRMEIYAAAKAAELEHVAFLLFEEPQREAQFEPERPVEPRGRPLTLGERKYLARCQGRELLRKLAQDPHPDVVSILLGNPQLTESDVLRIASRRPVAPETLMEIVFATRFRTRPRVRRSLCLNPNLPIAVAARLLNNLGDKDLADVSHDRQLPAALRLQARNVRIRRGTLSRGT